MPKKYELLAGYMWVATNNNMFFNKHFLTSPEIFRLKGLMVQLQNFHCKGLLTKK